MGGTYRAGYTHFLICQGQVPLYAASPGNSQAAWKAGNISFFKVRLGIGKAGLFRYPLGCSRSGRSIEHENGSMFGKYVTLDGAYECTRSRNFPVPHVVSVRVLNHYLKRIFNHLSTAGAAREGIPLPNVNWQCPA